MLAHYANRAPCIDYAFASLKIEWVTRRATEADRGVCIQKHNISAPNWWCTKDFTKCTMQSLSHIVYWIRCAAFMLIRWIYYISGIHCVFMMYNKKLCYKPRIYTADAIIDDEFVSCGRPIETQLRCLYRRLQIEEGHLIASNEISANSLAATESKLTWPTRNKLWMELLANAANLHHWFN